MTDGRLTADVLLEAGPLFGGCEVELLRLSFDFIFPFIFITESEGVGFGAMSCILYVDEIRSTILSNPVETRRCLF